MMPPRGITQRSGGSKTHSQTFLRKKTTTRTWTLIGDGLAVVQWLGLLTHDLASGGSIPFQEEKLSPALHILLTPPRAGKALALNREA